MTLLTVIDKENKAGPKDYFHFYALQKLSEKKACRSDLDSLLVFSKQTSKSGIVYPWFPQHRMNQLSCRSKVAPKSSMTSFFPFEFRSVSLISTDKIIVQAVNRCKDQSEPVL